MNILLDTCTFLWLISDAEQLSETACKLFKDPDNEVYLSAVSTWEIVVKHMLGRLPLPHPPEQFIPEQRSSHGIDPLPLDEPTTFHLLRLPPLHRDPFDRMLICQAIERGLVILTPDPLITRYPVRTAW